MSVLALPSSRPAPQRVVTVAAELPAVAFFGDNANDGQAVLDMHVVFAVVGARQTDRMVAFTNLGAVPDTDNNTFRAVGVSLDTVVHTDAMRSHAGERAFAVAVSGLVPVAVPGDALATAVVGDWLFVQTTPSPSKFSATHRGPTFVAATPTPGVAHGQLLGTIYGVDPANNYCLVLLHL
jgi:hypothetical protein